MRKALRGEQARRVSDDNELARAPAPESERESGAIE